MSMNVEAGSFAFLIQQIKSVHKDLLTFQARTEQRFEKIDGRLNGMDGRFDRVEGRLDRVEKGVRSLREDMPGIVGNAMREVQREQRRKSRKTS